MLRTQAALRLTRIVVNKPNNHSPDWTVVISRAEEYAEVLNLSQ